MCVIRQITWLHPNGAKQTQQYYEYCERSVNGHFCSLPPVVDSGILPVPPMQPGMTGEEQESQESTQYQEYEEEPKEKRLNWVRSRRKKYGSTKKRDVYIREAELETGVIGRPIVKDIVFGAHPDAIEYRRSQPKRYWHARVLAEDVLPYAPTPPPAVPQPYPLPGLCPYPPNYAYPNHNMIYPHQGGPPGALAPGPFHPPGPPPPPFHGPEQVIQHQAAQLSHLQNEHHKLIKEREDQARRLKEDMAAANKEKESVVAENKDLKKKLKRQTKRLEDEHKRGRSREREKEKVKMVEVDTDELIQAKLSFAKRKLQEDKLRRRIAESRARQEDMSRREARHEREREDKLRNQLEKERAKRREQEEVIEDIERERARSAERGRLRRAREPKTEAWAIEQTQDFRRSHSQNNRHAPPSAWWTYSQGPRRSYSVNGRAPPPPPVYYQSRLPPPPPPPIHVKPRRSRSFDARSKSSGIGGSSTSTSSRRHNRGGSSETSFKSYSSSSSSGKGNRKEDKKKTESRNAYVEDYVDVGGWDRINDPIVYEYYEEDVAKAKEGKEKDKKKRKGVDDKPAKWVYK